MSSSEERVLIYSQESCWGPNGFKWRRQRIWFEGWIYLEKNRTPLTFQSDYGIFYDLDDGFLLYELERIAPSIRWDHYVYWRRYEPRMEIVILDPLDDSIVGRISVRGTRKEKRSRRRKEKISGENVILLDEKRGRREERKSSGEESSGEESSGDDIS